MSVLLSRKLEFNQPDVNIENMAPEENVDLMMLQIENTKTYARAR